MWLWSFRVSCVGSFMDEKICPCGNPAMATFPNLTVIRCDFSWCLK